MKKLISSVSVAALFLAFPCFGGQGTTIKAGEKINILELSEIIKRQGIEIKSTEEKTLTASDSEGKNTIQTESGELKREIKILKGATYGFRNGKQSLVYGYIAIDKGSAFCLEKDLVFVVASRRDTLPDDRKMEITLVRETGAKRWIATNGVLLFDGKDNKLAEGHTVNIVGGLDNPVRICGENFSDATVVIQNGQAVLKSPNK